MCRKRFVEITSKNMFIVIDGIDGSWKTTQIQRVRLALEAKWKTVKLYNFPQYGKSSAYFVEKYLAWEYGNNLDPKLSSLFYALDRFDGKKNLEDDIKNFDYILSDRYVSANMIHQGGKIEDKKSRDDFFEWIDNLEHHICQIPKPDRVLFLHVSPKMSEQLVEKRWDKKDIHEQDSNHTQNAYASALSLSSLYDNWTEISCENKGGMKSKEEITEMILNEIL